MKAIKTNKAIIIMGVSGSGKTTIGQLLAQKTQLPFFDGDDFHSKANIDKMASGNPLNDEDRKEWLLSLNQLIQENITQKGCIVACSSLKKSYRNLLSLSVSNHVKFVFFAFFSFIKQNPFRVLLFSNVVLNLRRITTVL